jgi:hypothetical protein
MILQVRVFPLSFHALQIPRTLMLVWWTIQWHNYSDRMHCFTPQTKQAGTQNNTQLLQQPKNSVCQTAKKLQHSYSGMQKSLTLVMWIWVQQSMETPCVTWCNNSQEYTEDAFCKAWSVQHDNATHTPYWGHMSCCSNFSGNLWTI